MTWEDAEFVPPPPTRYWMPLDVYVRESEHERKWQEKEDRWRKRYEAVRVISSDTGVMW